MDDVQIETIEHVRRFLTGSGAMKMAISSKEERYASVLATLIRFRYLSLKKAERGVLLKYLQQAPLFGVGEMDAGFQAPDVLAEGT